MLPKRSANDVLEAEFLSVRAKILEVAAALDRLDRGEGDVAHDPRREGIRRAIDVLQSDGGGRAEEVQLIFSRHYDSDWKRQFGLLDSSTRPELANGKKEP